MAKVTFPYYLTRLHELGAFGIALSEAKRFMELYTRQNPADTTAQEQADLLPPLLARWSNLENEADSGTINRQDLVQERNQINVVLHNWLNNFKKSPAAAYPYEDFGVDLPADLREKIWVAEKKQEPFTPPSESNGFPLRWIVIGGIILLAIVFVLYKIFSGDDTKSPDTSNCAVKVHFSTRMYSEPNTASPQIMVFKKNLDLLPLDIKIVKTFSQFTYFFKVKVDGVEGWINYDETDKTPACFTMIQEAQKNMPEEPAQTNNIIQTPPATTVTHDQEDEPANNQGKRSNTPTESGCYLTGGMLTMVFSEATMFSERISQLKEGKKYKILDKAIYNHGGLSKYTFYKVDAGNGNIGWVKQAPDLNIPGNCR